MSTIIILSAIFVTLVGADQLLKLWAMNILPDNPIPVIDGILEFYYHENRGAAFGMLQGGRIIFIIVTLVITAAGIWAMIKLPLFQKMGVRISTTLIIAGGIGNWIDRVFRGYVVDFIYFKPINFPIFNLADSCVTCGAIALAIFILFSKEPETLKKDG